MTKSALGLAREALSVDQGAMPPYSHRNCPKKFTQPQLLAVLAVREMVHVDFRRTEQLLKDWSDLRKVLALREVPHYSTLCRAHERLLKKGLSSARLTGSLSKPEGRES
jgi:hypothetical protein